MPITDQECKDACLKAWDAGLVEDREVLFPNMALLEQSNVGQAYATLATWAEKIPLRLDPDADSNSSTLDSPVEKFSHDFIAAIQMNKIDLSIGLFNDMWYGNDPETVSTAYMAVFSVAITLTLILDRQRIAYIASQN